MAAVIMLVPVLVMVGAKFDERYGEKLDLYLLKLDAYVVKKFDERKARKTR